MEAVTDWLSEANKLLTTDSQIGMSSLGVELRIVITSPLSSPKASGTIWRLT